LPAIGRKRESQPGRPYQHAPKTGATGRFGDIAPCLARYDLHIDFTYQPNSRYWTFQALESGFYLVLTGLLTGVALWRVRRH
jgi:hypothetical protein